MTLKIICTLHIMACTWYYVGEYEEIVSLKLPPDSLECLHRESFVGTLTGENCLSYRLSHVDMCYTDYANTADYVYAWEACSECGICLDTTEVRQGWVAFEGVNRLKPWRKCMTALQKA